MRRWRPVALGLCAFGALAATAVARGQVVHVEKARTLVVGEPRGARTRETTDARDGFSPVPLPLGDLRTSWRLPLGVAIDEEPVVDEHGVTYVVGHRGDVVAVSSTGEPRWRATTSVAQPGPSVLTADDTVVFVDMGGQAVGVRDGAVRWRVSFAKPDAIRPAPLALDDGGVVVATGHELAALDADGNVRAWAALPEPSAAPLIAALSRVIVVATNGTVWSWLPGEPELTRMAAFDAPIPGDAILEGSRTLIAISSDQERISTIDLLTKSVTPRAATPGIAWLGPPAFDGKRMAVLAATATDEVVVWLDENGRELAREWVGAHAGLAGDAGSSARTRLPPSRRVIDRDGTIAFATIDGALAVARLATPGPAVERLPDICSRSLGGVPRTEPAIAGLAPLGPGELVVACPEGVLVGVHAEAEGARRDR